MTTYLSSAQIVNVINNGPTSRTIFVNGETGVGKTSIERAIRLHRQPEAWARLRANAMATDVSWARSARRYAGLFHEMLAGG